MSIVKLLLWPVNLWMPVGGATALYYAIVLQQMLKYILRNGGDIIMCGNEQAAPWCLVLTGNTPAATESEAATLKLPDVAADVFPTIHPSL